MHNQCTSASGSRQIPLANLFAILTHQTFWTKYSLQGETSMIFGLKRMKLFVHKHENYVRTPFLMFPKAKPVRWRTEPKMHTLGFFSLLLARASVSSHRSLDILVLRGFGDSFRLLCKTDCDILDFTKKIGLGNLAVFSRFEVWWEGARFVFFSTGTLIISLRFSIHLGFTCWIYSSFFSQICHRVVQSYCTGTLVILRFADSIRIGIGSICSVRSTFLSQICDGIVQSSLATSKRLRECLLSEACWN